MPELTSADLTTIRTRPIGRKWKLYIYQPVLVAVLEVGGSPSAGDRVLTTSTQAGDPSNGVAGQTCYVTDSGGNLKIKPSKVRFKSWAANTLTIAENAIDWAAGDLVSIFRLWELWPRIPYFSGATQYKDRNIAWASDAQAQPPKANAGPAAIATLGTGGYVDVTFKGFLSWSSLTPIPVMIPFLCGADTSAGTCWSFESPTGVAPASLQWDALGGSPSVQGGSETTLSVTYRYSTAGYYYVSLTVTDSNGQTGVRYVPVIIDDGTKERGYTVPGDRSWAGDGWRLSRRTLGLVAEADASAWYDGAPVFLVADDSGAAERSFAGNRQTLRWSGWLKEDTTQRSAYSRGASYQAVSLVDLLANIPAYPTAFRSESSPSDWYEFTQLSIDSVVYLLLRWHSTVCEIADYFPMVETGWTSRLRPGENCRGQDLLSQVNYVLRAARANLRCDRQGSLRAMRGEWFLSAAEKATRETVMTLALQDIVSASYGPVPHQARTREVRLDGVSGASTPYLSGSPGASPLDGGKPMEDKELAPVSQAELDQWSGQQLALENWGVPLRVKMAGEYDVVDPALGEYVAGSLSSFDSQLPDGPYSVRSVRFEDDHERGVTTSEWELLLVSGQYHADARPLQDADDRPATPPDIPNVPPVDIDEPVGTGERAGVAGEGGFFYCGDARTGGVPSWTAFNTGLSDSSFIISLCNDPRRSTYAACIDNSGGVFTTEDWFGGDNWASSLTEAAAETLIEAAHETITSGPDLVLVRCFAKTTDETGVLVVVAQYTTATGDYTRVLYNTASDWASGSWVCGGEIPGFDYLGTVYKSYTVKQKDNAVGFVSNAGQGDLVFDGTYIYIVGESMRDNALASSMFNWSDDWGATWSNTPEESQGGVGNGSDGPRSAACDDGRLYVMWWKNTSTTYILGTTTSQSTPTTVESLTDTAATNQYGSHRDMFTVLYDGSRAVLKEDSGTTYLYIDAVQKDDISVEYRTVKGFEYDEDFMLIGRSWFNSEKADGVNSGCLARTVDQGVTITGATGNLYALGCRSVVNIIFDWVTD